MESLNNLNLIDTPHSLASSVIWDYSSNFYKSEGPNAWNPGKIPYSITHHHLIVEGYAKIIKALIVKNDNSNNIVTILEIGCGIGHFAWLLIREVESQLQRELTKLDVKYVLSDLIDSNLSFASNHPQLKGYFERELLETFQFEISGNNSISKLYPGTIVVVANYAFDSSPQDIFHMDEGEICLIKPTIYGSKECDDFSDDTDNLHFIYEKVPTTSSYYNESEINRILYSLSKRGGSGYLSFPINVLRFLISIKNEEFVLLTSDLPRPEWKSPLTQNLPQLNWRGGIWMSIDFEVLNSWINHRDGQILVGSSYKKGLTTAVCISKKLSEIFEKDLTSEDFLIKSPDSWLSINNILLYRREDLSISELIEWLHFCMKDPDLLKPGLEMIRLNIDKIGRQELHELQVIARISQKYYFARPGGWDFFGGFAEIFFHLNQYELAKKYWYLSIYSFKENLENLLGLALTYTQLDDYTRSADLVYKILRIDSTYAPALSLKAWIIENNKYEDQK